MSRSIQQFVDARWDESIIPALCEYVRIPNKSPMFDPDWEANGHMQAAVELLNDWCDSIEIAGMTRKVVKLPGRTPVLIPIHLCSVTTFSVIPVCTSTFRSATSALLQMARSIQCGSCF